MEDLRRRNLLGEHLGWLFRDLLRWSSRRRRIGPQRRLCRGWARRACGWTVPTATACIGVPTPARPGPTSAFGTRGTYPVSAFTPTIRISSTWRRWATPSGRTRTGACSVRPTAAGRGRRYLPRATRSAPLTCRWTQPTPGDSTPQRGGCADVSGISKAVDPAAACFVPSTAATHGSTCRRTRASQPDRSGVSAWRSPLPGPVACGQPWRPASAACTDRTTTGNRGSCSPTIGTCRAVPGTTSTYSPIR